MMRSVESQNIRVRQGTLQDQAAIAAFTQNTFSWGDYVPGAWERWVKSTRGDLLVAERNGAVVGTVHVRYLEQREAWLEGVRVQPEHRRQNIATILIQAAHANAKKKHCRTMRLETGARNTAAQRAFEKLGYRRINEYVTFQTDANAQKMNRVRAAKISDVAACMNLWQTSWMYRSSRNIVPSMYGWRWWEWNATRLRHAIRAKNVWVTLDNSATRAFMVARVDDSFDVILLAGQKRAALHLLTAARKLASEKNLSRSYWMTPKSARAETWARDAGYTLDDVGMLIYERSL